LNQYFAKVMLRKIFIINGLRVKYSNQTSYVAAMESPDFAGAFFFSVIQYSGWGTTDTPRECAGLARVLVVLGLDSRLTLKEMELFLTL
jgi:hypothetical protein